MSINHDLISYLGNNANYSLKCLLERNEMEQDAEPSLIQDCSYVNQEKLTAILKSKKDVFKCLGLNIQSINAKIDQLQTYIASFRMNDCQFDAICLQETWLSNDQDTSTLEIDNYNLILKPYKATRHGGLGIYLDDSIQYEVLEIDESPSNIWEGLFIKIVSNDRTFILGNVYRPPRDNIENYQCFTNEFDNVVKQLSGDVVICGDFNINLLKFDERTSVNDFLENILSNGYLPKITLPTRLTRNSGTLIDNAFVKMSNNFSNTTSGIVSFKISDHLPYYVCLDFLLHKKKLSKYIKITKNSINDINNLKQYFRQADIIDQLQQGDTYDVNVKYKIFSKILEKGLKLHMPTKIVKYNKYRCKEQKWITQGILNSIRFRDKLFHKLKITPPSSQLYNTLKINLDTYKGILKKSIRQAKRTYYHEQFSKFKNDLKSTWRTIKDILGSNKDKRDFPDHFMIDNTKVTDNETIAKSFNTFFTEIGPKLADRIEVPAHKNFKDFLRNPSTLDFNFHEISDDDTMKSINELRNKSSIGIDGISSILLKQVKNELCKPITYLINCSINTGVFPDDLKIAKVIPIFKKNDKNLLDNYRPISILPAISKIFEKIIHKQINSHFTLHKLFYTGQYGFRHGHSTELAATELIDRIAFSMDKGEIPINIFMDLSKAFDTIDHDILTYKLKHYGFKDNSLSLLSSYLTGREQFVEFNDVKSNCIPITTGVPQGSILGPLLFIIYLNDINLSSDKFQFLTYADDTTLFVIFDSAYEQSDENISQDDVLNAELEKVADWLSLNRLSLNKDKTKCMIFRNYNKIVLPPKLVIKNQIIEQVNNFNFLGIILDSNLNWKAHTESIGKKISKTIGIMNRLKHYLPMYTLKTIYNSLINSRLNYGILCWGLKQNGLVQLQKKAVRVIVNANYNAHADPIFKRLNILKVDDIAVSKLYKFYYRYTKKTLPHYFLNSSYLILPTHTHETRTSDYILPRIRLKNTEFNVRYQLPLLLNENETSIIDKVNTLSEYGFSFHVKRHLISLYKDDCPNPGGCYSCNRR